MTLERMDATARAAVQIAAAEARAMDAAQISTIHVLIGALSADRSNEERALRRILDRIDPEPLRAQARALLEVEPELAPYVPIGGLPFSAGTRSLLESAGAWATDLGHGQVRAVHLAALALAREHGTVPDTLQSAGIDRGAISKVVHDLIASASPTKDAQIRPARKVASATDTDPLEQWTTDLVQAAADGLLLPVGGRDREIRLVCEALGRMSKSNPVLVGDPGVGKTAIVEGLAQRVATGDCPHTVHDARLHAVDMGALVAGSRYRGQFEDRLKALIDTARADRRIVLFFDEIHTLLGAGSAEGSLDASTLLKPALARGELRVIGATTSDEWTRHVERDRAFERRLQPIHVDEPDPDDALVMLGGAIPALERHHHVTIAADATAAAVSLTVRHLPDRRLPDKAFDALDQACARAALNQDGHAVKHVTAAAVAGVVSDWTGVPAGDLADDDASYRNLDSKLSERVVGQPQAARAAASALRRAHAGMRDPARPVASLLFCGPTGVGKTEMARAIAEFLFASPDRLVGIDMSEFAEAHTIARLVGSPPGYTGHREGGQLTDQVRRRPHSVVLLDEIDKAHRDVTGVLLQILEDGQLTDGRGRHASFRDAVIVMTSNIGARWLAHGRTTVGFAQPDAPADHTGRAARLRDELCDALRPELVNRIDDIVIFDALSERDLRSILDRMLREVQARARERGTDVRVTPAAANLVLAAGTDPQMGARPLRRAVQRLVEDPIAEWLIDHGTNGTLVVRADGTRTKVHQQ